MGVLLVERFKPLHFGLTTVTSYFCRRLMGKRRTVHY